MSFDNSIKIRDFVNAINDAASMLAHSPLAAGKQKPVPVEPLPSLLEQCRAYCERPETEREPIRTIHHFACTGGSLISKCIAAMPNTEVLSEVDPLSIMQISPQRPRFAPTDLIQRIRDTALGYDDELVTEVFLGGLSVLYERFSQRGVRLVLRDHSHSHFCTKVDYASRPTFGALIETALPTVSVITVRHPLDSYLSVLDNGWLNFAPPTLDEYCRRYGAFLDSYHGVRCFRYEDFVGDPRGFMEDVCHALSLPFDDGFLDNFMVIKVTGDSGRKDSVIAPRPRRPVPQSVAEEIEVSAHFQELLHRLNYE